MKQLITATFFTVFISLSGCAVIHFENGEVIPDPEQHSTFSLEALTFGVFGAEEMPSSEAVQSKRHRRWYHHAIFQIAELSNPLEIASVCRGLDWNQVTTEVTPFDAIMGLADNALLFNASSAGLDLWSPWSIEYSCKPLR